MRSHRCGKPVRCSVLLSGGALTAYSIGFAAITNVRKVRRDRASVSKEVRHGMPSLYSYNAPAVNSVLVWKQKYAYESGGCGRKQTLPG